MVDLRWLNPLPAADIVREAAATGRVLVVDETRRSGGVGEGVLAALVDAGYVGAARRVASVDSFIPLGNGRPARAGLRGDDRAGCPLPAGRLRSYLHRYSVRHLRAALRMCGLRATRAPSAGGLGGADEEEGIRQ